jgi:hypothetical protein
MKQTTIAAVTFVLVAISSGCASKPEHPGWNEVVHSDPQCQQIMIDILDELDPNQKHHVVPTGTRWVCERYVGTDERITLALPFVSPMKYSLVFYVTADGRIVRTETDPQGLQPVMEPMARHGRVEWLTDKPLQHLQADGTVRFYLNMTEYIGYGSHTD